MFFGYCIKISTEITPIRNRGRNTGERLTLRGQVITAHKLRRGFYNISRKGWTNHRANRLIDLATLTFRFCEASATAQGVEESFGCTARQARYADLQI